MKKQKIKWNGDTRDIIGLVAAIIGLAVCVFSVIIALVITIQRQDIEFVPLIIFPSVGAGIFAWWMYTSNKDNWTVILPEPEKINIEDSNNDNK